MCLCNWHSGSRLSSWWTGVSLWSVVEKEAWVRRRLQGQDRSTHCKTLASQAAWPGSSLSADRNPITGATENVPCTSCFLPGSTRACQEALLSPNSAFIISALATSANPRSRFLFLESSMPVHMPPHCLHTLVRLSGLSYPQSFLPTCHHTSSNLRCLWHLWCTIISVPPGRKECCQEIGGMLLDVSCIPILKL